MVAEIGKNEPKDIKNGGLALSQVSPNWGAPRLFDFFHLTSPGTRKVYHPFRRTQAARKSLTSSTGRITNEQPGKDAAETGARISLLCTFLFRAPHYLKKTLSTPEEGNALNRTPYGALPGTMEDSGGRTFIILPIKAIFHIAAEIVWRQVLSIFSNFTQVFGNE